MFYLKGEEHADVDRKETTMFYSWHLQISRQKMKEETVDPRAKLEPSFDPD
jgi:hypothetical protein